jgi:hypothetical protein
MGSRLRSSAHRLADRARRGQTAHTLEGTRAPLSQRSNHRRCCRGDARATPAPRTRPLRSWCVVTRFGGCRKECLGALAHRSARDQPDSGEMLRTNANTVRQNRAGLHSARRRRDAGVSSPNADDAHSTLHRNQQLKKRSTDPRPDRQTVPSVVPNVENPHLNRRLPPPAFPLSRFPAFPLSRPPLPALRNPTYPRGQVHDLTSKP